MSQGILCCTLKALIRGEINSISSYLKKSSRENFHLEEKLLDLQHLHSVMLNADIKPDIIRFKNETDDIYAMDIRKKNLSIIPFCIIFDTRVLETSIS